MSISLLDSLVPHFSNIRFLKFALPSSLAAALNPTYEYGKQKEQINARVSSFKKPSFLPLTTQIDFMDAAYLPWMPPTFHCSSQ